MTGRTASFVFLAICVVLALLLLTERIDAVTSGWAFAISLVVLGVLSRDFRRR